MTTITTKRANSNDSWRSVTITAVGAVIAATLITALWIALGVLLVGR
jgi:hypothetical protein